MPRATSPPTAPTGRVGRITDPNGLIIDLAYDVRGRLISRTVDGKTTAFEYDGVGQLTKVTPPDGAYLRYTYDAAHRQTAITDALGNKIHTTYDLAGNKTKEEVFDPAGALVRTHRWVYDTLSRLSQSIGAAGQTTTYAYDANGNLTTVTDPLGRLTTYTYDALNRTVSETDPLLPSLTRAGWSCVAITRPVSAAPHPRVNPPSISFRPTALLRRGF